MRLKHIKNADLIVGNSKYTINNPKDYKGHWKEVFGNDNPIEIEIGTGKGKFIISKALDNENVNYIGIEKYDSPLVGAVKKLEDKELSNLKLICFDAINIGDIFDHEIKKIYLNFSDPWPKKKHAKRRLTSSIFLEKYSSIFDGKEDIELKTDNDDLFDYSLISFEENNYEIKDINRNIFDKYTTEYEDKFIGLGKNINYVHVVKK